MLRNALLIPLILSSCSQHEDFSSYQSAVRNELLDPESAQFRNESIRTLWSQDGRQIKIYCAEVNAKNAYGGRTGYQFVRHIIETRNLEPESFIAYFYRSGSVYVEGELTPNYYLDCIRRDTERGEGFGSAIPTWAVDQSNLSADVDAMVPVLSYNLAPLE